MLAGSIEIQLMAGIARLSRDMDQARGVVNKATSDMARAANAAKNALAGIGAGISFAAIASQIGGAQRRFDVLNSSLITATGSVANAAGAFKALSSFASSTPYGLAEVTQAFVKMRNMGLDPSEAALRSYGNTAAAMGKSLNMMVEAVADAATGEFERLKEFGIKARQNGDQVALTFQGVTTTIGNNAREIESYLQKLGNTEFAGGMELRAKTLDGAISNLGDTWEAAMLKLSQTGGGDLARESVIGVTGALTDLTAILDAASAAADKEGNSAREMGLIHRGLTTIFETVTILGINVAYTFTQVGKELGGLAAQATAILTGDFAGAKRIGEMMRAEAAQARKDVDARTAAILGASAKAQAAMKAEAETRKTTGADALAQFRIEQAEREKATATAAEESKKKAAAAKALADMKKLEAAAEKARLQAAKEIADAAAEAIKIQSDYAAKLGQSVAEANREADANEELARTFGMSRAAIELENIARMEERLERLRGIEMADDEIAALEKVIEAKKRSAAAMSSVEAQAASKKATEDIAADYKRMSESIESSLTDALLRGFESGKSFGRNLIDTLKNMFSTLILRPTISGILAPVTGGMASAMMPGAAQAASGSGGGSAVASGLSSALGIGGSMAAFGGTMATGFMSTMTGVGLSTSLGAGASMIGGGAIASGLGMVAGALGPIALALAAAVLIWKKLDTSGTYHTGGASSASASGVSTIRAESLGMAETRITSATNELTASLASGMVKILDSTAQAFGKTAGYEAATAFADDTSKDGAWGALVIKKMGETVLDWNNGRASGSWAPKEFGDGEAGQREYLAALSASVRAALDDIGLPSWAQTMLDGLGNAPSIEELAKVVDAINATQGALKVMGESLKGFADLSDGAVSALMKAAGGIESLSSSASAYYENFYTESEKSAGAMKQVSDSLTAVGLAMPASRVAFRAMVEAQMALGESGMPAVAALFKVSSEFARLHPIVEQVSGAASEATDALAAQAAAMQSVKDQASGLLDGVDASMAVLQRVINTEKSRIAEAHTVTMTALQQRIDTESTAIAKHKSLSDAIGSTLDQMRGAAGGMDRADAQAQVAAALAIARAGGALPSADSLKGALSVLSKDSSAQFATLQDYQRDFFRTQGDLAALGAISDTALSVEEKSLAALIAQKDLAQKSYDAEVMRLDAIVTGAQQQIDVLRGIDTTGLSIKQAIEALSGSILAAQKNPLAGSGALINDAYKSALGRAPDAAGSQFWQDQIAGGTPVSSVIGAINNSQEAQVQALYKQLLGRNADAGGLNFFMNSGASIDAIRNALMQSDEYKKRVPGFAAGGDFGGGLRIVGERGPELEATGPSRIFNARQTSQMLGGDNSELVAEVRALRTTVERQQSALDRIAGTSKRTADTLDIVTEGGNAMRTTT